MARERLDPSWAHEECVHEVGRTFPGREPGRVLDTARVAQRGNHDGIQSEAAQVSRGRPGKSADDVLAALAARRRGRRDRDEPYDVICAQSCDDGAGQRPTE